MIRSAASSLVRLLAGFSLIILCFVLSATLLAPGALAQATVPTTTTITVTSPSGAITLGDTVTLTATVAPAGTTANTPSGLVTFFDGSTPLGSGTLNGATGNDQAAITTALLSAAGSPHSITAVYQGDANFTGSTSSAPAAVTVNLRTSTTAVTLSPTTVVTNQSSTATVTVTDSGAAPPGTPDVFSVSPPSPPATGRTGFTSTLFADGMVLVAGGTDANNHVLQSAEIFSVSGAGAPPAESDFL